MKRIRHYFEHQRIYFEREGFTTAEIESLQVFSEGKPYYQLMHGGLQFKEYVGVLQVGRLTIEVLPKVDRREASPGKWRNILLDMLKECRLMQPEATGLAALRLRANSVLELYFEYYLQELQTLLRQGLIRKYRSETGNQYALKGRLLFGEQIRQNLVHAERFYTEHTVYDRQHELHQVLRQALEVITQLSANTPVYEKAMQILDQWPVGKALRISDSVFGRFPLSRKTQPYQEALQIARLILLNYHPDLRQGRTDVLALLFDMNELWERFIFTRVRACASRFNWQVRQQQEMRYWQGTTGGKKLIPDILIETATGKRIVIDTKWKQPPNQKPDDHDLRQLLAYKLYFEGDEAFLLYPCYEEPSYTVPGLYHPRTHQQRANVFKDEFGLEGGLLFFNLINNDKLLSKKAFAGVMEGLLFTPL